MTMYSGDESHDDDVTSGGYVSTWQDYCQRCGNDWRDCECADDYDEEDEEVTEVEVLESCRVSELQDETYLAVQTDWVVCGMLEDHGFRNTAYTYLLYKQAEDGTMLELWAIEGIPYIDKWADRLI